MSPRKKEPNPLEKAQAEFDALSVEDAEYDGAALQLAYAGLRLATDTELTAKGITEEAAVELKLKAAQSILQLAINNKDAATATQIGPSIDTLQHLHGVLTTKPKELKKATRATRTSAATTGGVKT